MEPFIVSARKYRPQSFKDVVGQQAITNTLQNAIDNNHLAQALLFCGPRGVGKTTCARILAKQINQDGSEREDEDFAFNIFELDAASNNSVDDIRSLIDQVRIPPQVGKYKVYIIDEVHMLSQSAFNAFLKTLEEPPKHAIFILATTEKHKIIPTILSRCQIFDFKRITVKDAAEYLKYIAKEQGINAEDDALHIIAQKADGAMRDALSIFDRVVSFSGKELTRVAVTENLNVLDYDTYFTSTDLILEGNIPGLLLQFNETLAKGFEGHHYINGLASHFRDLMICKHQDTISLLEVGAKARQLYLEQSQKCTEAFLLKAIDIANQCDLNYKTSKNHRLLVELTLMKLASLSFEAEKKKSDQSNSGSVALIPASFFKSEDFKTNPKVIEEVVDQPGQESTLTVQENSQFESKTHEIQASGISKTETLSENTDAVSVPESREPQLEQNTVQTVEPQKKIQIKERSSRVSGLSLSSLKAKKAHEESKKEEVSETQELPKEQFTEEDMQREWQLFIKQLEKEGRKILASSLSTDLPKLQEEHVVTIELPNSTMKKEIEKEQQELLTHLRKRLNNYLISLKVRVNEEAIRNFAYTPEEKYQKLREKNPAIDILRKEFDLDL